jgi:hypothetical protein
MTWAAGLGLHTFAPKFKHNTTHSMTHPSSCKLTPPALTRVHRTSLRRRVSGFAHSAWDAFITPPTLVSYVFLPQTCWSDSEEEEEEEEFPPRTRNVPNVARRLF